MAGIDSLVSNRADMFAGNPQGLQQRYAMSQDLLDLLALQKLKKDKEAAQRDLQMQMQAPAATVKDQLAGQVMDMTKQEVASSLAPGIQQQGQAMQAQQLQQAMGGIASQPAPNMVGMARGGIVGYAPGGDVQFQEDFVQTFTTPEGERLTRDDLMMMRREGRIPQELMLTDSSGQRLTVSDAIYNPMSRSDEVDLSPEGVARRMAYERIGTERNRPLPESPEDMLARTMGEPGGRDVRSVRTMPRAGGVDAGGLGGGVLGPALAMLFGGGGDGAQEEPSTRRSRYDSGRAAQGNQVSAAQSGSTGMGLRSLLSRVTTPQSSEAQARSKALFAGAPQTAGEMSEPTARLPQVPSLYEMLGGDPDVMARPDERRAYEASLDSVSPTPATQAPGQPTTQLPTPRTGIVSGMSAEEAAMQAMDARAGQYQGTDEDLASMLGEDVAPMQQAQPEAPQDPRLSRSEQRLEELKTEQTDKLGALIEFLLAAGASGGTNLGATLTGGGSGLMARDARIKDEIAKTIQNIETLELRQSEMAQRGDEFTRGLEAEERLAGLERKNRLDVVRMQVDDAVARAEAAAGADLNESYRRALSDARKAMEGDRILDQRMLQIQKQYKNNPTEMEVQMQIAADEFLGDYMGQAGFSTSSANIGGMKAPAPTN